VGVKNFIKFLKTTGFIKIEMNKEKLGLSLILGGCSVTLDELTAFYSSFTNNGQFRKLTYYKGQTEENSQKIFSAETSYLIAEILSVKQRNDMIVDYDYSKLPRFAWKTGTSFGKRDGWAIGFNPNYTIGVWVGNFEGSGSPSLTGADAALPLLADLFNAIDYKSKIKWFKKPDDVYTRDVCAESGLLPTSDCNNLAKEIAIRDRSHSMICNIHESLFVNETATIQFCADCLPESGYKRKTYMLYHPGLVSWFGKNNIPYENPPRHNPSCSSRRSGDGPKIISPSENFEYYVEEKSRQEIVLMAASNQEVRYHFWYVNNKFIGKSKPGQKIFYVPDRNVLDIVCLDDLGGEKSIRVAVKKY
jgi:penicillin-binding protein 1C